MKLPHPDATRATARTTAERAAFEAHLDACPSCAFEDALARDLAAPADPAWIDRTVDGALERLAVAPVVPLRRPRAWWMLAAAALLVAAAAFAASRVVRRPGPVRPAVRARVIPPSPPAPVAVPSSVMQPSVVTPPPVATAPREVPHVPGAAELYRRANEARHARHDREAVRLYDVLLDAHPSSREAIQARVSLARLLLDRREQLSRAASLFDEHLRRNPGAPDEEAAMAGRARAFELLGRAADERRAWEALLARHPGSLHAEHAHERLRALR